MSTKGKSGWLTESFGKLIETFKKSSKEATKKCASESEKLRFLIADSLKVFDQLVMSEKFRISLMDIRIYELYILSVHIMYLSLSGLYRNVFDNLRYIFESAIQSLYIDSSHSISGLRTKIEILKEIEDKREYRSMNLIDKLEIDHKDSLKKEYKRLSQIIHPSHRSIVEMVGKYAQRSSLPEYVAPVNCKEISNIYESMKIVFDMVLFLYISCSSEKQRNLLQKNADLIKYSKKYHLGLLSKILKSKG